MVTLGLASCFQRWCVWMGKLSYLLHSLMGVFRAGRKRSEKCLICKNCSGLTHNPSRKVQENVWTSVHLCRQLSRRTTITTPLHWSGLHGIVVRYLSSVKDTWKHLKAINCEKQDSLDSETKVSILSSMSGDSLDENLVHRPSDWDWVEGSVMNRKVTISSQPIRAGVV